MSCVSHGGVATECHPLQCYGWFESNRPSLHGKSEGLSYTSLRSLPHRVFARICSYANSSVAMDHHIETSPCGDLCIFALLKTPEWSCRPKEYSSYNDCCCHCSTLAVSLCALRKLKRYS